MMYQQKHVVIKDGHCIVPEGVLIIGRNTFKGRTDLKTISLPNSLLSIHKNAFSGCINLECVDIPPNVTFIGELAFNACVGMMYITFPPSLKTIEKYALNACIKIRRVALPMGVDVDNCAFLGCLELKDECIHIVSNPIHLQEPVYTCKIIALGGQILDPKMFSELFKNRIMFQDNSFLDNILRVGVLDMCINLVEAGVELGAIEARYQTMEEAVEAIKAWYERIEFNDNWILRDFINRVEHNKN